MVFGPSSSWVSVTVQDDRVVVFGASGGFYAHAFRADTGKTIFGFSTDLRLSNDAGIQSFPELSTEHLQRLEQLKKMNSL